MLELMIFHKNKILDDEILICTSSSLINHMLLKLYTTYKEMLLDRYQLTFYTDEEKVRLNGEYDIYSFLIKTNLKNGKTFVDILNDSKLNLEEKISYLYVYTYGHLIGNSDKKLQHLVYTYIQNTMSKFEEYIIHKENINLDEIIESTVLYGHYSIYDILKSPLVTYKTTVRIKNDVISLTKF